jgi:iron complex outermembrane recepter protein
MPKLTKHAIANSMAKGSSTAVGLMLLLSSQAALAQTAKPGDTASADAGDIIVTAQKREQLAIKTPLSLTALDTALIKSKQVNAMTDLQFVSPGIRSGQQQGVNRIFIRGIGLTSFAAGADSSIAFYEDGVYIGRPTAQLTSFFDIERIEVLRGPQGALYGRNATGGAVNLIANEPTKELSGYANFTAGNYKHFQGEGAVSGPLNADGSLRARLAGFVIDRGGYGRDVVQNYPVNNAKAQSFRGTLQYNPSDAVDIKLIGNYHHEKDNNNSTSGHGAYPGYVLEGVSGAPPFGALTPGRAIVNDGRNPVFLQCPNLLPCLGVKVDAQDVATSLPNGTNARKGYALTLDGKFELTDELSLTSITGWRKFNRFNASDSDATSVALGNTFYTEKSKQVSQEFTLNYSNGPLDLIAGAVYFHETLDNLVNVPFPQFGPGIFYQQLGVLKINAKAAYLQGTYAVTPAVRITAAGRYSSETRKSDGVFTFFVDTPLSDKKTWHAFNPKFGIEFDLAPKTLLYASVTNGFKSGTFNVGQVNPAINPEKIWAYEAGIKSRLLDDMLEISAAAFHYQYKDLQVSKVIAIAVQTANAAAAKNTGFEMSIKARPTSQLTLDANFTYLKARFTEFLSANALVPLGPTDPGFAAFLAQNPGKPISFVGTEQNLKGYRLPGSPRIQFTLGGQYVVPLSNDAEITLRADGAYSSRIEFSEFNDINFSQKSVFKTNLYAKYDSGKSWTVALWGKNVTNRQTAGNKLLTIQLWGYPIYGSMDAPRTFGGTVGVKF